MEIKKAEFIISAATLAQCPDDNRTEFAFIGRSNVGKSSLINMLTNHKGLAKTSATPGKTLLLNHFNINDTWRIVDLPGYGFAKRPKKVQDDIARMINDYILNRGQMANIFLLIDIRLEPQKIDINFMNWLGENGIPFSIVFTKADKLAQSKVNPTVKAYLDTLLDTWEVLPPHFITSAAKGMGRDEILDYIDSILSNT